jgi:hypothetical protein
LADLLVERVAREQLAVVLHGLGMAARPFGQVREPAQGHQVAAVQLQHPLEGPL